MNTMNHQHTPSDLRKFGFILGGLFAVIFGVLIPAIGHNKVPSWPWIATLCLWVPATIYPRSLTYVYKVWMKIGDILGFINTRIILGILFFFLIWPIGILKRIFGTDAMGKQLDPSMQSYRTVIEDKDIKHMEKPF